MIDAIGLIASLLIVTSMLFRTTTYAGTMVMRIINALGSIFFVYYGFIPNPFQTNYYVPNALATGITNGILFIVNMYYIYKEYKVHKGVKFQ